MGSTVFPAASAGITVADGNSAGWGAVTTLKNQYVVTLTSGTSWTVPTGCTYVIATLYGGGGGGGTANGTGVGSNGAGGGCITTRVITTPGASISYSIGAGGAGSIPGTSTNGSSGGSTSFTGATSASGGGGGAFAGGGVSGNGNGTVGGSGNGGSANGTLSVGSGTGGSGKIELVYWV